MKKVSLLKPLLLLFALIAGSSSAWAGDSKTVTYAVESTTSVTATGDVPAGTSATYASTYGTKYQLIKDNSMTLTLKNYLGYKITNITLSMKSNASKGAGKLSYSTDGGTTYNYIVGSSSAGVNFNDAAWYGSWSTTYVNISKDVDITATASDLLITLEATANSLYCQSFAITYTAVDLDAPTVVVSETSLDFGKVDFGTTKNMTFTVTPSNLTGNLSIACDNAKYTVSPTSIAQSTTTATTITVTAAPTAIDNDMNGTITISGGGITAKTVDLTCTVTDPAQNNGTLEKPFTVADVNDGTASGSDVYVIGYIVGEFISKDDDAKTSEITTVSNFALSDSPTEISGANTIAIQLPSGAIRTAWNLKENNVIGLKVRVKGDIASYFTGKTGVKNTSEITALLASIAPAKAYTTYVTPVAMDFTSVSGLKAFVATAAASTGVTLTEPAAAVPAKTPLVLKKVSGTSFEVPVVASGTAPATNLLKAGPATMTGDGTEYILVDGLFYQSTAGALATGKAYLKTASALGRELTINWGDETAINALENATKIDNGAIYDLSGRRVENPTKGIYIMNGKKVVIR